MAAYTQGSVSVIIPDSINLPADAGRLSARETGRLARARRNLVLVCSLTADAMVKNPVRLNVPDLTAASLSAHSSQSADIEKVIADLELLLKTLRQARMLIDHGAHTSLRRVLSFVRSQEKFDPCVVDLVPALIEYFARSTGDSTPTTVHA